MIAVKMRVVQLLTVSFSLLLLLARTSLVGGAPQQQQPASSPSSTCTSTPFGYELLATRLDSLENAITKAQLLSTETFQNLRADFQQLTGSVQSVFWNRAESSSLPEADVVPPRKVLLQSCDEFTSRKSGLIWLDISRGIKQPFEVFCDQKFDGGGWLVFQNRFDGSVDFYRPWDEYKEGFGSLDGEFWLGLEKLHQITYSAPYELAIVMEDFTGDVAIARYSSFAVGSEAESYNLNKLGTYTGTANDSLSYHLKGKFSTFNADNDEHSSNCAETYIGAWWYKACHHSNLNGKYLPNGLKAVANKFIVWRRWKGDTHPLKKSRMMIRRVDTK